MRAVFRKRVFLKNKMTKIIQKLKFYEIKLSTSRVERLVTRLTVHWALQALSSTRA